MTDEEACTQWAIATGRYSQYANGEKEVDQLYRDAWRAGCAKVRAEIEPKLKEYKDAAEKYACAWSGAVQLEIGLQNAILSLTEENAALRDALERQKKCWHKDSIGCLAECSITCEVLAKYPRNVPSQSGSKE